MSPVAARTGPGVGEYGVPYVTGPLWRQYASMWGRGLRHAVPE